MEFVEKKFGGKKLKKCLKLFSVKLKRREKLLLNLKKFGIGFKNKMKKLKMDKNFVKM